MEFRLLGPVEVRSGAVSVPLGGVKPRTLLAALLLERGRVVSADRLVDLIWGDRPPPTARALVQTYVAALRRSFAAAGLPDAIATRPPGYAIDIDPLALDLEVFQQLLAQERLPEALALWRGPALAGLEQTRLAGEAARLNAMRLAALEERIAADLRDGHHDRLLAELTGLVHEHPTNERLRGQLMQALHAAGRSSDALGTYQELRERLAEELGIDPGPELSTIHLAILREESTQDSPAQLPHQPADFTGREAELAVLREPAQLSVITGQGGTGKSTLAIRAAHELAPAHPGGQLYAELCGMSDAPTAPGEVLGRFLRALGVEASRVPDSVDERAQLYRTVLAGRKMLVLLDDAGGEEQVRPLLPGGAGSTVIVTSRHRLGGLAGARLIELGVMAPDEAVQLLRRIAGDARVRAESQAALRITAFCGRLPLALRVAGARLANRPRLALGWLADRLADESRRLRELSPGDAGLEASIALSYRALADLDRKALQRLGFFGVPDFAPWVLGWLLDVPLEVAEEVAERLVDAQLLEFIGADRLGNLRYRMHDLVRLYAREQAKQDLDKKAAVARVLGGWLRLIEGSAAEVPSDDVRWVHRVTEIPAVPTPEMADPRAWFETERKCMVAGVERAAAIGLHDLACAFTPEQYSVVFAGPERFALRTRIISAVIDAARAHGDLRVEAIMLADYGLLQYLRDQYAEARLAFFHALSRFRDLGDERGEAATLARLGTCCREAGRLAEALHFLDRATALFDSLREETGVAYARRISGSVRLELGAFKEALSDLLQALDGYGKVGSRRGEGLTLRSLSLYHRAIGELPEAIDYAERSRVVFRELGDEFLEAYSVRAIAKARLRQGRHAEALADLEWSLGVSLNMQDTWGQGATMRCIAQAHLAAGDPEAAQPWLESAVEVWRQLEAPLWRARTEWDLAAVYAARGDEQRTAELRARAMAVFHDHGAREAWEHAS